VLPWILLELRAGDAAGEQVTRRGDEARHGAVRTLGPRARRRREIREPQRGITEVHADIAAELLGARTVREGLDRRIAGELRGLVGVVGLGPLSLREDLHVVLDLARDPAQLGELGL